MTSNSTGTPTGDYWPTYPTYPTGPVAAGHCGRCGAPYFYDVQMWHGIFPPAPRPTCWCWNLGHVVVKTTSSVGKTGAMIDELLGEGTFESMVEGASEQ